MAAKDKIETCPAEGFEWVNWPKNVTKANFGPKYGNVDKSAISKERAAMLEKKKFPYIRKVAEKK